MIHHGLIDLFDSRSPTGVKRAIFYKSTLAKLLYLLFTYHKSRRGEKTIAIEKNAAYYIYEDTLRICFPSKWNFLRYICVGESLTAQFAAFQKFSVKNCIDNALFFSSFLFVPCLTTIPMTTSCYLVKILDFHFVTATFLR